MISTCAGSIDDDLHPAWYLIIFGGFGFLFDVICMYCFSIWGDPEEMGLGAKGAPAAADVEGGAPGAPDTMQPKMSKVRSAAVHGTEVAEKKASAMNMCGERLGVGNGGRRWRLPDHARVRGSFATCTLDAGSLSHVMADSIRSLTAVCVGIAASGWKRKVNGARADAIGALICAATILVVMIVICRQWVKALQVYLNYDQYEDTYLERPSTKPQGIAHVISSATSFTKKGETIY